jgi:short-subunit dehydrogenase
VSGLSYFSGQRALVTGASAGIGAEFARQLHTAGADLILVARRLDKLAALAEELEEQRENSVEILAVDLTDGEELSRLIRIIEQRHIDILINNAGRGSFGTFDSLSIDEEILMVRLNIEAPMKLTHAVLPQLRARRAGAVLYVSSVAGYQPLPYMATYAATKAFDLFHAQALRQELRDCGVRVLALCPGPTATEFAGVARVPGTVTSFNRDDVRHVVQAALRSLANDHASVVPGIRSAAMALLSRFLPMPWTSRFVEHALRKPLEAMRR